MLRSLRFTRLFPTLLLAAFFTTSLLCRAQDQDPTRAPDGNAQVGIPGIVVLPYPGMPFTGSFTGVRTFKTQDGSTITTSSTVRVARDSQGRIFRERHYYAPLNTDPQTTLVDFFIFDPTAHTQLNCIVATKRCVRGFYYRNLDFVEPKPGAYDHGRRILSRDSLGQKTFGDLTAIGTRETVSIAPGTIGNDQTLTLTRDFWYSPDLKTNLQVIRTDPRTGNVTLTLTVDSRSEPDPSLFTPPSGYFAPPLRTSPPPGIGSNASK